MPVEITSIEEYNSFLSKNPKCIIDFGATWCGPCKKIAPFFHSLEDKYPDIAFAKIDVDTPGLDEIVNKFANDGIPIFVAFSDKQIIGELLGASEAKLTELVNKLLTK
jgi:thioredoxin 1